MVCTCLVAARKLPTTSAGHSSVPAQTPALHESTGATYRRWLRCGTVAAESPAPATSCRHTGQMCCSDMLHIFRYRLVAAARMLTVRSSADTRTNTARGRYLGPPRGRSPRRVYRWQKRARKTKRHSVRKTNHQSLHNSIRRPESTPRNCAPECCTQSSIVPNVQPRTQVISPGPVANGLTQCRPPAEAPPATPAAAYASHASRSSLQQKHTPAEAHSSRSTLHPAEESFPPWKECVCAHGDRVRRQKPRPPKRATRHAQAQAQANRLMTYYGYAGRYP